MHFPGGLQPIPKDGALYGDGTPTGRGGDRDGRSVRILAGCFRGKRIRLLGRESAGPPAGRAGAAGRKGDCPVWLAGWMVDLSLWCCRVVWNGGILLLTMSFACAGLCFLFSLGVLTVLLCQGYPFTGLAIGCLGAVLCCTALTVSCCTFFAERAVRGTVRDAGGGAVRGAKGNARGGAVRRAEGNASGAAKGAEGSVRGIEGKGAPEDHGQEG